jgi:hypothetical protein
MKVDMQTTVVVDAKELATNMNDEEIAEFMDIVAQRFNDDFTARKNIAETFAHNLSEIGCRFLAEIVTSHYCRNRSPRN